MMLEVVISKRFRKDLNLAEKQNRNLALLDEVISRLANGERLEVKRKDHTLSGFWRGYRECHIQPDWLLVYRIKDGVLSLITMGTHSTLFGK